jgi:hypothetical protein
MIDVGMLEHLFFETCLVPVVAIALLIAVAICEWRE